MVQGSGKAFRDKMYECPTARSNSSTNGITWALVALLDTQGSRRLTTSMDASELEVTARMARLALSTEEQAKLQSAVEQMLAHFSHMREIDVGGLAPTTHALLRENRLREDVESRPVPAEALLENAPEREERFIVIPNVL